MCKVERLSALKKNDVRHRELKQLAGGHTGSKRQRQNLNPGSFNRVHTLPAMTILSASRFDWSPTCTKELRGVFTE